MSLWQYMKIYHPNIMHCGTGTENIISELFDQLRGKVYIYQNAPQTLSRFTHILICFKIIL